MKGQTFSILNFPLRSISPFCFRLVAKSCPNSFVILWTVAHQAPLSVGFPRQEYWSGLPFLSPGDLPPPGIKPATPILQAYSLLLSH